MNSPQDTALFHASSYIHAAPPPPHTLFTQTSLNSRSLLPVPPPAAPGYYADGSRVGENEAAVQPLLMQAPPRAPEAECRSYSNAPSAAAPVFNSNSMSSASNTMAHYYPPNMLSMIGSASGQQLAGLMPYAQYYHHYQQQQNSQNFAQSAISDYYANYGNPVGANSGPSAPVGIDTSRAVVSDSGPQVPALVSGSRYPNFPTSPPGFYPASMNINVSMKMNLIGIQQPNSPVEMGGVAAAAVPTSCPPPAAPAYPNRHSAADAVCSNSASSSSGNGSDLLARSYQMLNSWKPPTAAQTNNGYCSNESLAYWYSCGGAYSAELGANVCPPLLTLYLH